MEEMVKIIKHQDAKYKVEEKVSGDTRINLSGDLFNFLAGQKDAKINFIIYKEDYIKALCYLTALLPLHYSPNSQVVEIENYSNSSYVDRVNIINDYFGDRETALYEAQFTTASGNRYWLCGLKNGNFNIRDFLVSERTNLKFIKNDDGTFDLRIIYNDNLNDELVIKSSSVEICNNKVFLPNEIKYCARRIINYLYAADEFRQIESFFTIGKTDSTVTIDDKVGIKMNGVFFTKAAPNYKFTGEGKPRAFYNTDYEIRVENKACICRLIVDWYRDAESNPTKKNSALLVSLIKIVNKYYSSFYHIDIINGEYILLNKRDIHVIDDTFDYSEKRFVKNFNDGLNKEKELKFAEKYLKSLLTKGFVILSGNSGTGKTKIARNFADLLGKSFYGSCDINNKLLVPVGADWTDNTKILGFYNSITHLYQPTEILNFIISAKANPAIPYFLILDEMNLSHVERYFSDFLSAMESKESIPLYKRNKDCKELIIPEVINLPENLFVTGTVNIDETTYMFSPKVLDRANVIEFIPEQSDVLANFESETQSIEITPVNDGSAEGFLALAKEVRETTMLPAGADVCKNILEGISNIFQGSGFEFAFRTAKEIRLYINAAYALAQNEGKTLEESDYVNLMDEQLLQKILPKIHGNRSQVGTLLLNLSNFCNEIKVEQKEGNPKVYKLDNSKKKIDRMLKQLETTQFTSFI